MTSCRLYYYNMEPHATPFRLLIQREACVSRRERVGGNLLPGGIQVTSLTPVHEDGYSELFHLARNVALARSLDLAQAEDVAQEVMIALWLRARSGQGQPITDKKRWVAAAARYKSFRIARARKRETPLQEVGSSAGFEDSRIDVDATLRELSARDRALVEWRYVQAMTVREIAATIGESESTVKRHLRRLRSQLADALADKVPQG